MLFGVSDRLQGNRGRLLVCVVDVPPPMGSLTHSGRFELSVRHFEFDRDELQKLLAADQGLWISSLDFLRNRSECGLGTEKLYSRALSYHAEYGMMEFIN